MSIPNRNPLDRPRADGPRLRSKRSSHPRALDALLSPEDSDSEDRFFVPSYLKRSVYVQQLQDEHIARRQAKKAAKQSNGNGPSAAGALSDAPTLPTGSYRGLAHSVIERQPSHAQDDAATALTPLPSMWNKDDMWGGIDIEPGNVLRHKQHQTYHERERDHEASAVRANHHIAPQCGLYYYEVTILDARRDDATIGIGFCTKTATLSRPIGWEPESYAYHGDDGRAFSAQNVGRMYSNPYNKNDTVGAGINFKTNTVFFTRNGKHLGDAFYDVARGKLFPAISLKRPGERIKANFGEDPFVFDICSLMKMEREKIEVEIEEMSTEKISELPESDLLQTLVLKFLQHDGYVDTARAFAGELGQEKQAMRQPSDPVVEDAMMHDNEDAVNRQRIRKSILTGDIAAAIKTTQIFYPKVLKENKQVNFKLRCRYFIEMVRRNAEARDEAERYKKNGASTSMDIDQNADQSAKSLIPVSSDEEILDYGQHLQTEFGDTTAASGSNSTMLSQLWSLMAYENPLRENHLQHLLDQSGRVEVAEELNIAILSSLGKSERAALEKLYGQTSVLLDEMRAIGGEGAFISMNDYMEDLADEKGSPE